ncbi:MAG: S-layer homology domain-containing protein [Bacillota bacterium]
MRRILAYIVVVVILTWVLPAPFARAQLHPYGISDVNGHWAESMIYSMYYSGVIDVGADLKFRPDEPITRLDFTVFTARTLELSSSLDEQPAFSDWAEIPEEFRGYVAAAVREGLIKGYPDGTFKPGGHITRAEMGVIFGRAAIKLGGKAEARYIYTFEDGDEIPEWAMDAMAAVRARIILGKPGVVRARFAPKDTTTRAEAVTMLQRLMEFRAGRIPQAPSQATPPRFRGPVLSAYYVNHDDAYASLVSYGTTLSMVIYVSYTIGTDGKLYGYDSPRTLSWARANNVPLLAMFANHNLEQNSAFLNNTTAQSQAIAEMKELMKRGYSGVNLDFEYVPARDRSRMTAFVRQLAAELRPLGYLVTISVPAKTRENLESNWVGAFDYAAIGRAVDYVAIMTYDQHWRGGPPGPIASVSWVESVLRYATGEIPAGKILLGIPSYGYVWRSDNTGNISIAAKNAPLLAQEKGATVTFDETVGENTFTYVEGGIRRTSYYPDHRSLALKLDLVTKYGLGGTAMWRIGYETPEWWTVKQEFLSKKQ